MFTVYNKTARTISVFIVTIICACCLQQKRGIDHSDKVSYNFHIRPLLSDKCFKCHGPDKNKVEAGLRLDLPDSAYAPLKETKGAYAIVPGKPEESELLKRISSDDPSYQMPTPDSHLGKLTEKEIDLVKRWIEQGAKYERHWAFTPPVKTNVPVVEDKKAVKNEIDHFIIDKLTAFGLTMNEEADKERLLKRLALDLTGIPPSAELINKYSQSSAENIYETVVDDLLNSPHYGEKMAILWLDIARYSDSYGYQDDNIRTQWPWRDWVIHAFNKNMPYNEFIKVQLAGDMLPNASKEQILATGFLRNHKYTEEGGVIPEEYRVEYNIDKTKTYSKGILGLTVECAQCHDHKYDPISQKDYFQLYAFFNNSKEVGYEGDISISRPAKKPTLTLTSEDIKNAMSYINNPDTASVMVSVMGERDTLRKTYILDRGVYDQPTVPVRPMAMPAVMAYDTTKLPANRLGLAEWTISRNNPLTARVFVNLVWQEIFGRGLVKTSGDFGMQGDLPSHPELLDWLAVDFAEHGWNIKRLVKQLVMSATYRQSAVVKEKSFQVDPENIYLSRAPRQRLKGEVVRDLVLSTSGLLNPTIGGPSVKPYQPRGLWEQASSGRGELATYVQDRGPALYRRGLYTFIKLTVPPPSMIVFDASNRDQCEVKRLQTNTPLQALVMMNDPLVMEASRVLAQRLLKDDKDARSNATKAFQRIICRKPEAKEINVIHKYLDQQISLFREKKLSADITLTAGEYPVDKSLDKNTLAALTKTITLIYNMEEAIVK